MQIRADPSPSTCGLQLCTSFWRCSAPSDASPPLASAGPLCAPAYYAQQVYTTIHSPRNLPGRALRVTHQAGRPWPPPASLVWQTSLAERSATIIFGGFSGGFIPCAAVGLEAWTEGSHFTKLGAGLPIDWLSGNGPFGFKFLRRCSDHAMPGTVHVAYYL